MKRIKKYLIGAVSAFAIMMTCLLCVKLSAATIVKDAYVAANDTTAKYNKGAEIFSNDYVSANTIGATFMPIISNGDSCYTVNANQDATKYLQFTIKKATTITIEFYSCESGGGIKSTTYHFGSMTGTTSASAINTVSQTFTEATTADFYSESRRSAIKKITYTEEGADPAVDVTAKVNYQFDNDDNKTAIRYLGTLENVTDLEAVESISIKLTLTDAEGTAVVSTPQTITNVYGRILVSAGGAALSGFDTAENTYYFVLGIRGIDAAAYEGCTLAAEVTIVVTGQEAIVVTTQAEPLQ